MKPLFIRNARINLFDGIKSLSTIDRTQIFSNLNSPRAIQLISWYSENEAQLRNITPQKRSLPGEDRCFADIQTQANQLSESKDPAPLRFRTTVTIEQLDASNLLYKACGFSGCMKKLEVSNDGDLFCEKCNRIPTKWIWRYLVRLLVNDGSTSLWITAFTEVYTLK